MFKFPPANNNIINNSNLNNNKTNTNKFLLVLNSNPLNPLQPLNSTPQTNINNPLNTPPLILKTAQDLKTNSPNLPNNPLKINSNNPLKTNSNNPLKTNSNNLLNNNNLLLFLLLTFLRYLLLIVIIHLYNNNLLIYPLLNSINPLSNLLSRHLNCPLSSLLSKVKINSSSRPLSIKINKVVMET